MMMNKYLAIALVAAVGCSKSNGDSSSPSGKAAEVSGDDVGAINGAISGDLKGKVEFEAGRVELRKGRGIKLPVPKGWKPGFMSGTLQPADAEEMGPSKTLGATTFRVGSDCNGMCEKKDWAKVADEVRFSRFTSGKIEGKVIKDEKGDNRRTLVFEGKPSESFRDRDIAVHVVVAWWKPDDERYYTCTAELGAPAVGLAAAFEKACAAAIVE
jgi:hypothetical protein